MASISILGNGNMGQAIAGVVSKAAAPSSSWVATTAKLRSMAT